jgi:hypothetical protein
MVARVRSKPSLRLSLHAKPRNRYVDAFLSTKMGDASYFGKLSFVLHLSNKTRIGCANFTMQGVDTAVPSYGASMPVASSTGGYNATSSAMPTGATPVTPTSASPTPSQFTGAAVKIAGGAGAMLAAAAAFVL